jgi:hypothetical protein
MHLVSNRPQRGPRVLPAIYSEAVRGAIADIRRAHRDAEDKLTTEDRIELAGAMQLLAIAAIVEATLIPLDHQS